MVLKRNKIKIFNFMVAKKVIIVKFTIIFNRITFLDDKLKLNNFFASLCDYDENTNG